MGPLETSHSLLRRHPSGEYLAQRDPQNELIFVHGLSLQVLHHWCADLTSSACVSPCARSTPPLSLASARVALRVCISHALYKMQIRLHFCTAAHAMDKPKGVPGTPGSLSKAILLCNANQTVLRYMLSSTNGTSKPLASTRDPTCACLAHVLPCRNAK